MSVLPACICTAPHVCWCLWKALERFGSPEVGITNGGEPPVGVGN